MIYRIKKLLRNYGVLVYPPASIISIATIIYYFPYPFIPDYFSIGSYSKNYELLILIISSISTLIGIYITVSLIGYEFFRQKSGIELHNSFLLNKLNASYVSFTITTILFAFFCSILITFQTPDNGSISLIYTNIILFIIDILSLLPVAYNLFSSLKPEQIAASEINKISLDNIFIKLKSQNDFDEIKNVFEEDHLLKAQEIVLSIISASDKVSAQYVMFKMTAKLADLIIQSPSSIFKESKKEYVTARLISFYINIADLVLLQPNNNFLLQNVWLCVGRLYQTCVEKKETAKHLEFIRKNFFERYLNRLFENNKVEVINEGVATVRKIIEQQVLFNMPPENEIIGLDNLRRTCDDNFKERSDYSDVDLKVGDHWTEVSFELMNLFSLIMNKSIKFNKPEIVNRCAEEINKLTWEFKLKETGQYKESYFYISAANIVYDYYYLAFKNVIFLEGSDAKHPTPILFDSLIEDQHLSARIILGKYCRWLISIQKLGKLDYWLLGGLQIGNFIITEGDLGMIAKRCAIKYKDGKVIQECLVDCIDTFEILKNYYEANPPVDFGLYFQIKKQFENILYWLNHESMDAPTIIEDLDRLIGSFMDNQ